MKRQVCAVAATSMIVGLMAATSVQAQEPLPPIEPNIIFDGWYGGVNGGYRWADGKYVSDPLDFKPPFFHHRETLPGFSNDLNLDSWIIGLHVGRNSRMGQNWMFGFEADVDWGDGDDSGSGNASWSKKHCFYSYEYYKTICIRKNANYGQEVEVDLEWQATLRARFGYITGPWLWFLTAGAAFAQYDVRQTANLDSSLSIGSYERIWWKKEKNQAFVNDADGTAIGPVVGLGFERAFGSSGQWSMGAEALWEFFGDTGQIGGVSLCSKHGDCELQKADIDDLEAVKVRLRISRKLN